MLLPITAVSQTTINGIHYYLNRNNKTAIVTHVHYSNDYEGSVVIPSKVKYQGEEYQVTEIGKDAFANCYNLTSVTIPDGVTTISRYAFSECYSLTTISIPQSVKIIGEGAFSWCEKLTSITLPNIGLIQERTFERCKSITSIIIPRSVVSIGYMAF